MFLLESHAMHKIQKRHRSLTRFLAQTHNSEDELLTFSVMYGYSNTKLETFMQTATTLRRYANIVACVTI